MKEKILAVLRAISPRLADRAVRAKQLASPDTIKSRLHRVALLEAEIEALTEQVQELREEIDESRRDALRVAELTDIIEHRLSTSKES